MPPLPSASGEARQAKIVGIAFLIADGSVTP
jgi:hypothetical protein